MFDGRKSAAHTDSQMAALVRRALAEVCAVPVLRMHVFSQIGQSRDFEGKRCMEQKGRESLDCSVQ